MRRLVLWRQVASLIVVVAVAGSTGVRAGTSGRVLTGELVETYCWAKVRVGGPEHARCAIECAKRGIPVGVMDEASRTLFVLLPGRDKATLPPELVSLMGRRVSIRGEIIQRAGANFVAVQSWQRLKP